MHTLNVLFFSICNLVADLCVAGVYVPQLVYIGERVILGVTPLPVLFETGSLVHRLAAL